MKKFLSVLFVALALLCTSCQTRTSAISDLRALTYDIRDYGSEYTISDWKKIKSEYDMITDRMSRYDYTPAQRQEIGELKGQCLKYFAKGLVTNAAGQIIGISSELKGIIEGLKK